MTFRGAREVQLAPFLPETCFMDANREPIGGVLAELRQDFPDRTVEIDGEIFTAAEALRVDDAGELTRAAREWLGTHTVGKQHGYDRSEDREKKIFISPNDARYLGHLSAIQCGNFDFVNGGEASDDLQGKNLLVGSGFPHLNAGRLRYAIAEDPNALWDVNTVAFLTGQRRRWNDSEHEATGEVVVARTASLSGLNSNNLADRRKLDFWKIRSPFARAQFDLREGEDWNQPFATEADMARAALEIALVQVGDNIFDWHDYPVTAHPDETAEPIDFGGYHVPTREVRAWEYHLNDGRSFYVVNGKAVVRDRGGEPRPTSASVASEAYGLLRGNLQNNPSVVAAGAPHIRVAYDTAANFITAAGGDPLQPFDLSIAPWEFHEPIVTGIASIPGMDAVDKKLRGVLAARAALLAK